MLDFVNPLIAQLRLDSYTLNLNLSLSPLGLNFPSQAEMKAHSYIFDRPFFIFKDYSPIEIFIDNKNAFHLS